MNTRILIKQSSAMRSIDDAEVHRVFAGSAPSVVINVPTENLADEVEQDSWDGHLSQLSEKANEVRRRTRESSGPELHYFGLAEVPHIVAFGALLGDERYVEVHDPMDRESPTWTWPSGGAALQTTLSGLTPRAEPVRAVGEAAIRVSISASVADEDVAAVTGPLLADITIKPLGSTPQVGLVRSREDVTVFSRAFRQAYAELRDQFPNLKLVHLFAAAPPSLCFVIGTSLDLDNGPLVQTYRYRSSTHPKQQKALLLGGEIETHRQPPTELEQERAAVIRRTVWTQTLTSTDEYLRDRQAENRRSWFDVLDSEAIAKVQPFPELPNIGQLLADAVVEESTIDTTPYPGMEYEYDPIQRLWKVSDSLLLAFDRIEGDEETLREVIRLFLFHEYVHRHHCIERWTVAEVGKFGNCLEHLDFQADAYALIHQLDCQRRSDPGVATEVRKFIVKQVDLLLKSLWAFVDVPLGRPQTRWLRRLFNWYWRLAQIERTNSEREIFALLSKKPYIELAGLRMDVKSQKVFSRLDELDPQASLEIALVRENASLFRHSESPIVRLQKLLADLRQGDHEEVRQFFTGLHAVVHRKEYQ